MRTALEGAGTGEGSGASVKDRWRLMRPIAVFGVALAMMLGMAASPAQAEENPTPGPTVYADPN